MIAAIITALLAIAAGLPFSRRLGEAYLLGIGVQAAILCILPWSRPMVIGVILLVACSGWLQPARPAKAGRYTWLDLATLVHTIPGAVLGGIQESKLAFPVAQHVRL